MDIIKYEKINEKLLAACLAEMDGLSKQMKDVGGALGMLLETKKSSKSGYSVTIETPQHLSAKQNAVRTLRQNISRLSKTLLNVEVSLQEAGES